MIFSSKVNTQQAVAILISGKERARVRARERARARDGGTDRAREGQRACSDRLLVITAESG